ncbi:MAG: PEP-utilizing enzyme [Candidatus Paceibacterota bacterium]|jgi:phosphohistidine swiveling domain-containing protein
MENKWHIGRTRYTPGAWPLTSYFDWPFCEYFGIENKGRAVLHYLDKGNLLAVWDKTLLDEFGNVMLNKVLDLTPTELENLRQKGITACADNAKVAEKFSLFLDNASLDDYKNFFKDFRQSYHEIMKYNFMYWLTAVDKLEIKIKKELENLPENEMREIISTMTTPTKESSSKKVDNELLRLVELAKENGVNSTITKNAIKDFSKKYFWFPYEYVGPNIWDEETVTNKVNEALADPKTQEKQDDVLEKQKTCATKYGLSKNLLKLFNASQQLALMQDDRKMYMSQAAYYLNNRILPFLGQKFGLERDLALYMDEELIDEKTDDMIARLKARQDCYLTLEINNGRQSFEGQAARDKFNSLYITGQDNTKSTKELKGQIAFAGKVTGKVRVLKTSQIDDFADGDIIVTGMTTPDFAPLLKRAAAIITNEGGITCHAAIVARELKKPCIIGTKIATQVLKDGDLVEVDADNGVVKILGKNK